MEGACDLGVGWRRWGWRKIGLGVKVVVLEMRWCWIGEVSDAGLVAV